MNPLPLFYCIKCKKKRIFLKTIIKLKVDSKKQKKEKSKTETNVKVVAEKASAAKDLCGWCLAMKTYSEVSKKVAPKKAMVKDLETKLNSAKEILDTKLSDLNIGKFLIIC